MKIPLHPAKRLKKWEKEEFVASTLETIESWDDGTTSELKISFDGWGPVIELVDEDGFKFEFVAWRINGHIHADFPEPGFIEYTQSDFDWIFRDYDGPAIDWDRILSG